ncbi:MAG: DNA mismatch repair endonuclease MutL [Flammeovirgaceae bacterium]|nr:DNA mismatch repair endonuclease MutL [Flammeovirgaceae bacterium]
MPDIIQLLPDSIANQIAAGEVVQRPASVVKELMENSVDAGATSIKLIIKDAGKTLVQVMDDGKGMSEIDARMSLERHATSKIRKAEDLFTLRTMGFRGEALASIAAVAQVEMKTRQGEDELGTLLVVEASDVKRQEPAACEKGTIISVKNLFYNIPARRNFLKSNASELQHIEEEFKRLALAYPHISFSLINHDVLEFDLPAGKIGQRIVNIFGKAYQQQLAACKEDATSIRVTGYVGKPEAARKKRGEQFLFVNNRFIRSNYLNHAVMTAFEGLLPEGSFPFYVLFIEIDPKHIDVNVHPTKTEIKFDDERTVYTIVLSAVRQALGVHNLVPAIDFHSDVNIVSKLSQTSQDVKETFFEERFQTINRANLKNWDKLFDEEVLRKGAEVTQQETRTLRFESSINQDESAASTEKIIFQLHHRYIIRQVKAGMMIIDQQAAHERVLFEKFGAQMKSSAGESQQSLFPQSITFSAADFALVMEMMKEIEALGFRAEIFGKNTLLVTGVPVHVSVGREKELFEGLIEQFKMNQSEFSLPISENLIRALAKRASIKEGQLLIREEMESLIGNLFACKTPNFAPDGRPTFTIFDLNKIGSYFDRP